MYDDSSSRTDETVLDLMSAFVKIMEGNSNEDYASFLDDNQEDIPDRAAYPMLWICYQNGDEGSFDQAVSFFKKNATNQAVIDYVKDVRYEELKTVD